MQEATGSAVDSQRVPRVWLVLGDKAGDNVQARSLAGALPWPFIEKHVVPLPQWSTKKPKLEPSIDHLDLDRTDPLEGPWPDLVVTVGRVPTRCALWIKHQTRGACRLVVIGKPRGAIDAFDLVVVASHYVIGPRPNVVQHELPLMFTDETALEEAKRIWAPRLDALPRPLVALMLGGGTRGLILDGAAAERIHDEALSEAENRGGSLFVTTSRRTAPDVVERVRARVRDADRFFAFDVGAKPEDNPYRGLLALADHFVVTLDSLSMLVDVARLGGGLSIAPLDRRASPAEEALIRLRLWRRLDPRHDPIPTSGFEGRLMMHLGRPVHARDMSAVPRSLVARGRAGWLGDPWTEPSGAIDDERERIAARVRALLA